MNLSSIQFKTLYIKDKQDGQKPYKTITAKKKVCARRLGTLYISTKRNLPLDRIHKEEADSEKGKGKTNQAAMKTSELLCVNHLDQCC